MFARKLMVCLLLAVFAFAAATVITTNNVHGTGRAVDHAGHRAYFSISATKTTHDAHSSLQGTFELNMPGATSADSTVVHLNSLEVLNVVDNAATLAGPGVLRVQHGTELHYFQGRVYVVAISNRHVGEAGPPDTISVHFAPAHAGDPTFAFEGSVTDGDIAVTTTLSY